MTDVIALSFARDLPDRNMHDREIARLRKISSLIAKVVAESDLPPSLAMALNGAIPHSIADCVMKARGNVWRACEAKEIDLHDQLAEDFRRVWEANNEYR